jgi:drug/metabolite transporter superfamily protein YnfA
VTRPLLLPVLLTIVTAVFCITGYVLITVLHPHPDDALPAYGLVIVVLAFVWAWAVQLLLDVTRGYDR